MGYLEEWRASVDARQGVTEAEKALMCLSRETIEGLHITGDHNSIHLIVYYRIYHILL